MLVHIACSFSFESTEMALKLDSFPNDVKNKLGNQKNSATVKKSQIIDPCIEEQVQTYTQKLKVYMQHTLPLCIVWGLLLAAAWPGHDWVVDYTYSLEPKSLLRGVDTILHGVIGALSWLIVCLLTPELEISMPLISYFICRKKYCYNIINLFCNVILAFCLAAIIDIDHIIHAFIIYIKGNGTEHWQRSWLHYSLPPLIICILLWIIGRFWQNKYVIQFGHLVLNCIIGHHIRDAVNHGLDFQPLYTTAPFETWLYIILTMIFPIIVSLFGILLL